MSIAKRVVLGAAAATLLSVGTAQAQVPEMPGFYASATGLWMFNIGDSFNLAPIVPLAVRPGNGPGFNLQFGYKFDSPWDVGVRGGAQWFRQRTATGVFNLATDANHQNIDLEAGYSFSMGPDSAARVYGGIRGMHFNQNVGIVGGGAVSNNRNIWGIGPKLGIGARTNLTENIGLVGGVDGALLIGFYREFGIGASPNYTRLMPQVGAEAGVQYRFSGMPSLAITAGARIDAYFNAATTLNTATVTTTRGNLIEVGPFVRVSYNLHAPNGAPPPMVPAPVVSGGTAYMVFFDFDRSNITPTASETIRKAAADAKAGQKTRVGVTGHADRSGSDAYNMALSLRRANAVKDELVRNGIPATAIAVVGRGESQPLVQTADGVREPQNRRVEIVLQ
ncbi:MAG: OmpA family protein [Alphaproteobacteria bacterium]|nr:OmpA family protein [Alphaproteobacteria bacterium]